MSLIVNPVTGVLNKLVPGHPYPSQAMAVEKLLSSQCHLLYQAPTGSGKTEIPVAAYLENWPYSQFDRLIYAVPLRTLADQTYTRIEKAVNSVIVEGNKPKVSRQTGEHPDDPHFEGDVIVTTIDQLLARYLNLPIGLTPGKVNVGPGALLGSLIVIDELQLLDEQRSLGTAIDLMRRLKGLATVLVMTATVSAEMRRGLMEKDLGDLVWLCMSEDPVDHQRHLEVHDNTLSVEAFLSSWDHQSPAIVVFNTVGRAIEFFRQLPQEHESCLLHSRFFDKDKGKKIEWMEKYFSRDASRKPVILVATQVIEAGVDISCASLHTEMAMASSLVQRFGRCVRYGGEGFLHVYSLPDTPNHHLPYRQEILELTSEVIRNYTDEFGLEQSNEFLDKVHNRFDEELFDQFNPDIWDEKVVECFETNSPVLALDMIRAGSSIPLVFSSEPPGEDFNPWGYQSINLHVGQLYKLREQSPVRRGKSSQPILYGYSGKISEIDDPSQKNDSWIPIQKDKDKNNTSSSLFRFPVLWGDSTFFDYSPDTGLELNLNGDGTPWISPCQERHSLAREKYSYQKETLEDHLRQTARLALAERSSNMPTWRNAGEQLALHYGITPKDISRMLIADSIVHDLGKSNPRWIKQAWDWQRRYFDYLAENNSNTHIVATMPDGSDSLLAHTDFDATESWVGQQKVWFPPHSIEGAVAGEPLLKAVVPELEDNHITDGLFRALAMAIVRHHNSYTYHVFPKFTLDPRVQEIISRLTSEFDLPPVQVYLSEDECPGLPSAGRYMLSCRNPEDAYFLPLYWLAVRVLRLADWKSQNEEVQ